MELLIMNKINATFSCMRWLSKRKTSWTCALKFSQCSCRVVTRQHFCMCQFIEAHIPIGVLSFIELQKHLERMCSYFPRCMEERYANLKLVNSVSNIFHALARNHHIWTRLRGEVMAVQDQQLTFELLKSIKYLQWVINESQYFVLHRALSCLCHSKTNDNHRSSHVLHLRR